MLIINDEQIIYFKNTYGKADMIPCYSEAFGILAPSNQAILLINPTTITVVYINKVSNRLVQKIEFDRSEIANSSLKTNLFAGKKWSFSARNQIWKFRIPFVLPLKATQKCFIDNLYSLKYIDLE